MKNNYFFIIFITGRMNFGIKCCCLFKFHRRIILLFFWTFGLFKKKKNTPGKF